MLDHLRQRVIECLSSADFATLSTFGAADLQATLLPCESAGLRLYILLPSTSDHMLNLQNSPEVVVTTADWQLRGTAVLLETADIPAGLALTGKPEAPWSQVLQIMPNRLHIRSKDGWGYRETIDIELESLTEI